MPQSQNRMIGNTDFLNWVHTSDFETLNLGFFSTQAVHSFSYVDISLSYGPTECLWLMNIWKLSPLLAINTFFTFHVYLVQSIALFQVYFRLLTFNQNRATKDSSETTQSTFSIDFSFWSAKSFPLSCPNRASASKPCFCTLSLTFNPPVVLVSLTCQMKSFILCLSIKRKTWAGFESFQVVLKSRAP